MWFASWCIHEREGQGGVLSGKVEDVSMMSGQLVSIGWIWVVGAGREIVDMVGGMSGRFGSELWWWWRGSNGRMMD